MRREVVASSALRVTLAAAAVAAIGVAGMAHMQAQNAAAQLNRGVPTATDVHVLPVKDNVSMIVGDGAKIGMSVGPDGVLLVDSGLPQNVDKLMDLVRRTAPNRPLRIIVNQNPDTHTQTR